MKLTRLQFSVATLAALTTLSLFGCGGGGTSSGVSATRELLAGTDSGSILSFKAWKSISIKPNTTYYTGSGAEVPCPAKVATKDGTDYTSCDPSDFLYFRTDGKVKYDEATQWEEADSFSIEGSDIVFTTDSTDPTSIKKNVARIVSKEIVNGEQRLRLRLISSTLVNGEEDPIDNGSEFVIEEVTLF